MKTVLLNSCLTKVLALVVLIYSKRIERSLNIYVEKHMVLKC